MKIEWYLKLCQGIFQNKKDLIEQKCGKELTRLPMNCTYWVVDCKDSGSSVFGITLQKKKKKRNMGKFNIYFIHFKIKFNTEKYNISK